MPTLSISEKTNIYYQQNGKGRDLLLLRGLARSSRFWLDFDDQLADFFKVLTLDNRGSGRSTGKETFNLTIETMARDCIAILDHLKIKEISIVGLSMGGMIALSIAGLIPGRIRSVMIINSSVNLGINSRINLATVVRLAFSMAKGKDLQVSLFNYLTAEVTDPKLREKVIRSWQSISNQEPIEASLVFYQLLASARFRLPKIFKSDSAPTLWIVGGSDDRLVPVKNSHRLQKQCKNSKLCLIPGGHELPVDNIKDLNKLIIDNL